ncbi:MAG: TrpR like protein, YerC/YecD [uncultured bacterium]|nr:MAG: TrpR like protein, YerC/YecD [uncultured bacterium]
MKTQFSKTESYKPRNDKEKFLVKAFLKLKTEKEMVFFLRDILTLPEIEEFANRLEIAKQLLKSVSYQKIAKKTGVSTTTVTRVAHWLFKGCGGYQKVLS